MPKTLMLALALLLSTAWAAQSQYPQTGSCQSGTAAQTTIQGCFEESNSLPILG